MLAVSGIPWVTLLFLLACAWVLLAAGGMRGALSVSGLLAYGAKATPLILDRGETWRLLSANLLHKDLLHLAFNAFAIWNVGGALERAVRPADYLALIIFTALGTTVASAVGADSISLGASGVAFGVLGASATFGWRRAVRGRLRAHFGLRLLPWLFALFLAGLGSAGVDNWGHGGGLLAGAACGLFLTPREWPGEAAARRLAAATGALLGTVSMGMFAAPALPVLGALREGPLRIAARDLVHERAVHAVAELGHAALGPGLPRIGRPGARRGDQGPVAPGRRGRAPRGGRCGAAPRARGWIGARGRDRAR